MNTNKETWKLDFFLVGEKEIELLREKLKHMYMNEILLYLYMIFDYTLFWPSSVHYQSIMCVSLHHGTKMSALIIKYQQNQVFRLVSLFLKFGLKFEQYLF